MRLIVTLWIDGTQITYGDDPAFVAVTGADYHASNRQAVITFASAGSVTYSGVTHMRAVLEEATR